MQLRGMSWRVLRCFKTSVVNVLRLLRPLIQRSHQSKYNFLSGKEWGKHGHSLKCSPLEGCITPRKVAETSTQLHGFEECHGESFAVCNRASLKSLAWLLRLLIHRSHQSKFPILSEIPRRKSLWSQFKVLTAGRQYHST